MTFRIQTTDAAPVTGLSVRWLTMDGSAESATCRTTDAAGEVRWPAVPLTDVLVQSCVPDGTALGRVVDGPSVSFFSTDWMTIPATGPVVVNVGPEPEIQQQTLKAYLPDGTLVTDLIWYANAYEPTIGFFWGVPTWGGNTTWWSCPGWSKDCGTPEERVSWRLAAIEPNAKGIATYYRFREKAEQGWVLDGGFPDVPPFAMDACYVVVVEDVGMRQSAGPSCTSPAPEVVEVTLPYLPVAEVTALDSPSIRSGSTVTLGVTAVDGSGEPIADVPVRIDGGPVTSAAGRCDARPAARTGPNGRVTLSICPTRTATWQVVSPDLVDSRRFELIVTRPGSPSAPRRIRVTDSGANTTRVAWLAPASAGSSRIRAYDVRFSRDGGQTWSPWRSTRLTRSAEIPVGAPFIVDVRARNARGGGMVGRVTVGG